jgi:hypothetical protein
MGTTWDFSNRPLPLSGNDNDDRAFRMTLSDALARARVLATAARGAAAAVGDAVRSTTAAARGAAAHSATAVGDAARSTATAARGVAAGASSRAATAMADVGAAAAGAAAGAAAAAVTGALTAAAAADAPRAAAAAAARRARNFVALVVVASAFAYGAGTHAPAAVAKLFEKERGP